MDEWGPRWHDYFLDEARLAARMSKDPSTQCGAVLVRRDRTIASKGYNGFPRYIEDRPELYRDRDQKYRRIIHAEANAILHARERLVGYSAYVWPWLPCSNCALLLIQAGIKFIMAPKTVIQARLDRFGESFATTRVLCREAGVELIETEAVPEAELISTSPLRR